METKKFKQHFITFLVHVPELHVHVRRIDVSQPGTRQPTAAAAGASIVCCYCLQ